APASFASSFDLVVDAADCFGAVGPAGFFGAAGSAEAASAPTRPSPPPAIPNANAQTMIPLIALWNMVFFIPFRSATTLAGNAPPDAWTLTALIVEQIPQSAAHDDRHPARGRRAV